MFMRREKNHFSPDQRNCALKSPRRFWRTFELIGIVWFAICLPISASGDDPPNSIVSKDLRGTQIEVKNSILKSLDTVSIAAGVAGVLGEVLVREGDIVDLKTPLAKVRDDEAALVVVQTQLALDTAKLKTTRDVDLKLAIKGAEVAAKELQRTLDANSRAADTYPANEVDRMRLMVDKSKLEIESAQLEQRLAILASEQAEAELRRAQQAVSRHTILSPLSAMIISIDKQAGEWVDPNSTVVELMTMNPLRVEGFIDASNAGKVFAGNEANVSISIGTMVYEVTGKVKFVSPVANPVNSQVRVFIEIDNAESRFRPGLSVKATVGGDK
jgi:multidrug efflux pump subunit AcrA (membrane-fusion protein)